MTWKYEKGKLQPGTVQVFSPSCFKVNFMFWTTVNCLFWFVTYWQTLFELLKLKLYRKWPEGKQKLLWVSRRFELLRVPATKCRITVNVWQKSWEKSILVWVSENLSYQESTVNHKIICLHIFLVDSLCLSSLSLCKTQNDWNKPVTTFYLQIYH